MIPFWEFLDIEFDRSERAVIPQHNGSRRCNTLGSSRRW